MYNVVMARDYAQNGYWDDMIESAVKRAVREHTTTASFDILTCQLAEAREALTTREFIFGKYKADTLDGRAGTIYFS